MRILKCQTILTFFDNPNALLQAKLLDTLTIFVRFQGMVTKILAILNIEKPKPIVIPMHGIIYRIHQIVYQRQGNMFKKGIIFHQPYKL